MEIREVKRVGIVGLGKMGRQIARPIAGTGNQAAGYDINRATADLAAKDGTAVFDSIA